jgi:hypothetical protein
MAVMTALNLNIAGFPAVNRDLTVQVRDPVSQEIVKTARPFLDGTVKIPQIAAGAYELAVVHPNVTLPVLRRPIRVLPVGTTQVSVLIDPSLFKNTPIEDIPDANLGPVRDSLSSIAESVLPLAHKQPGEAIKAEDFNMLASSIRDVALTVTELSRLVSPVGHSHPELETKFGEVTDNFQTLLNTLSTSLAELQRQIQAQRVRAQVETVLDVAGIAKDAADGRKFLDLVDQLDAQVTEPPTRFGRAARDAGLQLQTNLEQLIDKQTQTDPDFVDKPGVKELSTSTDRLKTQRATSYDAELEFHLVSDRQLGGGLKLFKGGV